MKQIILTLCALVAAVSVSAQSDHIIQTGKYVDADGVKAAFDANGIEIPFNQLDVHVKNN